MCPKILFASYVSTLSTVSTEMHSERLAYKSHRITWTNDKICGEFLGFLYGIPDSPNPLRLIREKHGLAKNKVSVYKEHIVCIGSCVCVSTHMRAHTPTLQQNCRTLL